jgi:hypothetical protein
VRGWATFPALYGVSHTNLEHGFSTQLHLSFHLAIDPMIRKSVSEYY